MKSSAVAALGEVRMTPVGVIKPYPQNPRKIPAKAVDQVAESIREFGWQQPIVVDPAMVIVLGHVRHRAALKLQLAEVPVVIADLLTEDQVKALRIAENRSHDYAAWDYGLLARELDGLDTFAQVLDLADWEQIVAGFEESRDAESDLDLSESERALLGLNYSLKVIFASQEAADQAGPELLKIPGVIDVRHTGG